MLESRGALHQGNGNTNNHHNLNEWPSHSTQQKGETQRSPSPWRSWQSSRCRWMLILGGRLTSECIPSMHLIRSVLKMEPEWQCMSIFQGFCSGAWQEFKSSGEPSRKLFLDSNHIIPDSGQPQHFQCITELQNNGFNLCFCKCSHQNTCI